MKDILQLYVGTTGVNIGQQMVLEGEQFALFIDNDEAIVSNLKIASDDVISSHQGDSSDLYSVGYYQ